jgi:hypothetical protein
MPQVQGLPNLRDELEEVRSSRVLADRGRGKSIGITSAMRPVAVT